MKKTAFLCSLIVCASLLASCSPAQTDRSPHDTQPAAEATVAYTDTDTEAETDYERDPNADFYYAVTRFDTAYCMNHFAATEAYLDRYNAVVEQIRQAEQALGKLEPRSDEYARTLSQIQDLRIELDAAYAEWAVVDADVNAVFTEKLELFCEEWGLDFEEWSDHLSDLSILKPGVDLR